MTQNAAALASKLAATVSAHRESATAGAQSAALAMMAAGIACLKEMHGVDVVAQLLDRLAQEAAEDVIADQTRRGLR